MKNLLSNLFKRKQDDVSVVEHVTSNQPNLDMAAFSRWCKELGVSSRVSKNSEFVVRMGEKQKIVQLHQF